MKGTSLNYNISIGDISVVVDFVNNMKSDMETRLLLFFIKSYYSIRLTQYYDELVSSLFSIPESSSLARKWAKLTLALCAK